ncbi:MAG: NADH-quinone oxidoreductase subunit L [Candidatus Eiseniibacteriota bacterium]|jgi:NADH-quinone oxidoreductase subunit L
MLELLWTVPALPLAAATFLALVGPRLPRRLVAWVGAGSIGLAAGVAVAIAWRFLSAPPPGEVFTQELWTWVNAGALRVGVDLHLDGLALVMMLVVTVVGFLIHLYATAFMQDEEGPARFFSSMNLFVGSMLLLVLGGNLLLLYLGWEGVGLCSFLLIGFWYRDPVTVRAARKAFAVTRIGDVAMAIGLFILFTGLGTLDIQVLLERAVEAWPVGSGLAVATAALLLGGATGKSAQLPLQTWLPDAMAGPTPVSALIHAATMVTAGVYLIARMHPLFELAPLVLALVAVIGAVTLLLAASSALAQNDLKRVLAYSTMSQIGYMFLALGVGAWSAAVFHLMTHAFFKALLFLAAGVVILAEDHEHDMRRMGGLRRRLPVVFWTFVAGGASLAAVPLVTAGFYSKDLILWQAWSSARGSAWLWGAGVVGAFLTALYIGRAVFLVFFGARRGGGEVDAEGPVAAGAATATPGRPGPRLALPLVVLAVLSVAGGVVETPAYLGGLHLFSQTVAPALPGETAAPGGHVASGGAPAIEILLMLVAAAATLSGVYLAYRWFLVRPRRQPVSGAVGGAAPDVTSLPLSAGWLALWHDGWGFDRLYERCFVRPFVALGRVLSGERVDTVIDLIPRTARTAHRLLSRTQSGMLRVALGALSAGVVVVLALMVLSS